MSCDRWHRTYVSIWAFRLYKLNRQDNSCVLKYFICQVTAVLSAFGWRGVNIFATICRTTVLLISGCPTQTSSRTSPSWRSATWPQIRWKAMRLATGTTTSSKGCGGWDPPLAAAETMKVGQKPGKIPAFQSSKLCVTSLYKTFLLLDLFQPRSAPTLSSSCIWRMWMTTLWMGSTDAPSWWGWCKRMDGRRGGLIANWRPSASPFTRSHEVIWPNLKILNIIKVFFLKHLSFCFAGSRSGLCLISFSTLSPSFQAQTCI